MILDSTPATGSLDNRIEPKPVTRAAQMMERLNSSVNFDQRLAKQDLAGSQAHVTMLVTQGIISQTIAAEIQRGLEQIEHEIVSGQFEFRHDLEDIHMNIESRLSEIIGIHNAGYLATARSRNDQVATDLRLWVRESLESLDSELTALQAALLDQAQTHTTTVMPGYTHLQAAQPVTLGHHLMAYVEMFGRDRWRISDTLKRVDECPLGCVALAGTSFPTDRLKTAVDLGFDRPLANSMDAVSDRDFALDYLAGAAICAVHLSRLAEELILWSSPQYNFIRLGDDFTTGSSIMPQKRNPDAAELIRAKSAIIISRLSGLLTVLKALPLTYFKDLQEDKQVVFQTHDDLLMSLVVISGVICGLEVNRHSMRTAAARGFPTATDLADWLVIELSLPFRRAYHIVKQLVHSPQGRHMQDLTQVEESAVQDVVGRLMELLSHETSEYHQDLTPSRTRITQAVRELLDLDKAVARRNSLGGTAPQRVCQAVAAARKRYLDCAQVIR